MPRLNQSRGRARVHMKDPGEIPAQPGRDVPLRCCVADRWKPCH